jgi:hypothetical protein
VAFSLLVRIILSQQNKALRHYCIALIYNILEPTYISNKHYNKCNSPTKDVDISIKMLLAADNTSPDFYGEMFPYFEPISWVIDNLPVGVRTKGVRLYVWVNEHIPEILKYLITIILGKFPAKHFNVKFFNNSNGQIFTQNFFKNLMKITRNKNLIFSFRNLGILH